MAIIDLRNYYPHYYRYSCIVEVQDDVAETLEAPRKAESARKRKIRRHGGEISVEHMMERGGLMFEAAFFYTSSDELLEKKYTSQVLHRCCRKGSPDVFLRISFWTGQSQKLRQLRM